MAPRLSFIVPTSGRPTLARTLASIEVETGDEILVRCDITSVFGNTSRDALMQQATGTHLLFIDDDDAYAPGGLSLVRSEIAAWPEHIHVFRMASPGDNNPWNGQEVRPGNVGTPMFVWPIGCNFARWAEDLTGKSDFEFINKTVTASGRDLMWHEEVLAVVRPA